MFELLTEIEPRDVFTLLSLFAICNLPILIRVWMLTEKLYTMHNQKTPAGDYVWYRPGGHCPFGRPPTPLPNRLAELADPGESKILDLDQELRENAP